MYQHLKWAPIVNRVLQEKSSRGMLPSGYRCTAFTLCSLWPCLEHVFVWAAGLPDYAHITMSSLQSVSVLAHMTILHPLRFADSLLIAVSWTMPNRRLPSWPAAVVLRSAPASWRLQHRASKLKNYNSQRRLCLPQLARTLCRVQSTACRTVWNWHCQTLTFQMGTRRWTLLILNVKWRMTLHLGKTWLTHCQECSMDVHISQTDMWRATLTTATTLFSMGTTWCHMETSLSIEASLSIRCRLLVVNGHEKTWKRQSARGCAKMVGTGRLEVDQCWWEGQVDQGPTVSWKWESRCQTKVKELGYNLSSFLVCRPANSILLKVK